MNRRKLIAGNWKMNGSAASLAEIDALGRSAPATVDVVICPPFTLITAACGRGVAIGAQDCHAAAAGAHTGAISAAMLSAAGARYAIIGHSERRRDVGETDAQVRAKATAVMAAGMTAILCVGETRAERDAGAAVGSVTAQLAGSLPGARAALVIAYEPVWAIGTGLVPTLGDIATMHTAIRSIVGVDVRILYGGSVTADNAAALLGVANVDGALVGGASLTAAGFLPIVTAAARS